LLAKEVLLNELNGFKAADKLFACVAETANAREEVEDS
jgi:hypothetical protein